MYRHNKPSNNLSYVHSEQSLCFNNAVKFSGVGKTKKQSSEEEFAYKAHMFTEGFHLAVSASVHLSPELMGALSTTAFRSWGGLCHFKTWDFDCQYCYMESCRIGFADHLAMCGGAPSRWLTSTAFWCLDTHRTSVGWVSWYLTLLPWIQWQRDVITLCCMKSEMRETGRGGK